MFMFDVAGPKCLRAIFLAVCVVLAFTATSGRCYAQAPAAAADAREVSQRPWLDVSLSVDARAKALLAQMTLDEKVGQMWQVNGIGGEPTGDVKNLVAGSEVYKLVRQGQLGSVMNQTSVRLTNAIQKVAVEESRLGIPLVFGRDVIHGYRTVFPIPLGQAASWNPELVRQASAAAAAEARSQGIQWTFAPMMDIARDPRWGRIAESLGEDPYLASALAGAMVRGLQGDDLASPGHIAACAKHFVGYGAAEGGRDYNTTVISPALLHNVYLRPFHAAVEAGVATVMCSFNEINGVPSSGNVHLLRDVLRGQWGFRGFVVSDWESTLEMVAHGFAACPCPFKNDHMSLPGFPVPRIPGKGGLGQQQKPARPPEKMGDSHDSAFDGIRHSLGCPHPCILGTRGLLSRHGIFRHILGFSV